MGDYTITFKLVGAATGNAIAEGVQGITVDRYSCLLYTSRKRPSRRPSMLSLSFLNRVS